MRVRLAALVVVAMLLLAGCSEVVKDSPTPTETPTPVEHHEVVFASDITPYNATITVERNGETVARRTVDGEADGTYVQVAVLESPGPYTVTVNATRGVRARNDSTRFTIEGDLGNATAVTMDWRGIYPETFQLPRRNASYPVGVYNGNMNVTGSAEVTLEVRVWYQGEYLGSRTRTVPADELSRLFAVEDTGVYRVAARRPGGEWTNATVVLADPGKHIRIEVDAQGRISEIRVKQAYRWQSERG